MAIKTITGELIEVCSGGHWSHIIASAMLQQATPSQCWCVSAGSGQDPINGGSYLPVVAIKRCFQSCCEIDGITHFITIDVTDEEYIGKCHY